LDESNIDTTWNDASMSRKLKEGDEGELPVLIGVENNIVIIKFGKDISWMGLTKELAIDFANILLIKAESIKEH
jgi:hypothetical protein